MPRVAHWDREEAKRLRAQGLGYTAIARAVGAKPATVAWWFKYAKGGPQEAPGKAGHSNAFTPEPKAERPAAAWDDEKRLALVECATQAVERTGMSLGACAVELARMFRERGTDGRAKAIG